VDEAHVLVEQVGSGVGPVAVLYLLPQPHQELGVLAEFLLRLALGHSPDDEPYLGRPYLLGDTPETVALAVAVDAARDTHIVNGGHEDQEAAGKRAVRGHPGSLGPDGLLDDLDHYLLTGFEDVLDGELAVAVAVVDLDLVVTLLVHVLGREGIGHVEEGVLLEPDVDKGGLHPGKDVLHLALVYAAYRSLPRRSFVVDFHKLAVLEDGDAGFPEFNVDKNLLLHLGHSHKGPVARNRNVPFRKNYLLAPEPT